MTHHESHPVAVVGLSAIMPDAPDGDAFWRNITSGRYSISQTPDDRWDRALYYDEDHSVPDKTYSTIGGWVREFDWSPVPWRLPVPPMVAAQMDEGQRWAISAARAALTDAGWPAWPVDNDRVAVILGNALGGEKHYQSSMRIRFPEMLRRLEQSATLATLTPETRDRIVEETRRGYLDNVFSITEDTMPGELANVIAGRVANLFNLRGMNFTTDAACASGLAALNSAVTGLVDHQFDAVVTGGLDRNMGVDAYVKFCKIGALSATGTRPFDAGADGFVMGEGAAMFVLKRLEDAERDGDRIYSVILGIGGSSDGKGKGITAPNPVGQQLAVQRAWERAGVDPSTAGSVEAHGTSTRVGDASELTSLAAVFGASGAAPRSIALGSVKSNIGHLKAAAGAAGLFKMVRSLHDKQHPPSLHFVDPNPNVDWDTLPFAVNTELRPWAQPANDVRRGGVSAFGFGGTNFHVVVEEHVPGRHRPPAKSFASAGIPGVAAEEAGAGASAAAGKAPLRGALVLGGRDDADLASQVQAALARARSGVMPPRTAPDPALAAAAVRVAVDHTDAADLTTKLTKLANAFASGNPAAFRLLRQQGIFLGRGPAPLTAFLYTGQGSQYVNMLKSLAAQEPVVTATFDEADRVMTPLLGRPLTSFIFVDGDDPAAVKTLNAQLMQTEITQPAVLAVDIALTRLLDAYGVQPDMVMGHSLGEYGALVAAGALTLPSALEAVSARGREMTKVSMADNGAMAAVFAPMADIQRVVDSADGYVVIANINSMSQAVVGGATDAVERIVERFTAEGFTATRIPVSHAFHTSIVAPASGPFVDALRRLDLKPPTKPVVANVTGDFYPQGATAETVLEYAGRQIASPVQFVKGLQTLYAAGARVFVEVGPKKALHGFVEDVLGSEHDDVVALFTNHPKVADDVAFNQALCGLYAAGIGLDRHETPTVPVGSAAVSVAPVAPAAAAPAASDAAPASKPRSAAAPDAPGDDTIRELGLLFADVLEKGMHLYGRTGAPAAQPTAPPAPAPTPAPEPARRAEPPALEPVVISGAALGLPGTEQTFDDDNVAKILAGQNFISVLGDDARRRMADMRITRLVKDATSGAGSFATIDDPADVIKLAGVHAPLDVVEQFGVDKARDEALDTTTRLAIGAGFDAMRDAGIPLVMSYKTTTLGTQLPDRWGLPEALRDETGVIFASAFPGYDRFAEAVEGYALDRGRREGLLAVEGLRARMSDDDPAAAEVEALAAELREALGSEPYQFDRRFLFRALSMGHSQFAEIIGARGPNTQVNAACASTTQALSLAEDWIRAGRCRRVVVVSADDATGEHLLPWVTAGFLASGAAATDGRVEDAATPFDRRRHGMIVGAGAAAFVVESADAARERGIQPIAEALATITANSAFHGSRLDVQHICDVMEALVREAEGRGVDRREIAARMMFVSHETYTPARGGSAAAEINALRRVFGPAASQIVITNTKGFTGHAMGAGIEDVVALKALETGIVPPVPNYQEPDPDLGTLNLSRGGQYPVEYALRLAAGFGSQVAMSLLRWTPVPDGRRRAPGELGYAYRVVDQGAWQRWLDRLAGQTGSRLEVDRRRLRVIDTGPATLPVERSGHVPVPYADRLTPTAGFALAAAAPAAIAPPASPAPESAPSPVIPVQQPAPVGASATPEPPAPAGGDVLAVVTDIVAEMTGYPADLLDPDLDLEADLGVDTVKQAEVFAAVRERWGLERDDDLRLRDFPTLNHVAGWVRGRLGVAAVGSPASASPVLAATPRPFGEDDAGGDPVLATVTQIVAEMTGYPADLLGADLDLEADLGVDTVKQAEVFAAVRTQWDLERDDNLQLREFPTLNHVAAWVRKRLGVAAPAPAQSFSATAPDQAAAGAPTAPVATPPALAEPVEPAAPAVDEYLDVVTGIVAEMTGYPADLLDPDLDLEADLGVDTVKQAEVFAAVRARWNLERDDTLQLREFPTLNHVAGWVRTKLGVPEAAAAAAASQPATTPTATTPTATIPTTDAVSSDPILDVVTGIVAEMTGYPADLLDPDLDLEADLGVDTVKQAEVFAAVRSQWNLERDDTLQLREFPTLNHVAGWVRTKLGVPEAAAAAAASQPATTPTATTPTATIPTTDAVSSDPILDVVTGIVAEMTGYPADLLDPDLDLEADLGVDTVKQAEVFAAVRSQWNLERDDTLQLREFPTLNHVAGWVRTKLGTTNDAQVASATPNAGTTDSAAAVAPHTVTGDLDAVDALPRRVPVPSLRPAADQCLPTGVSLAGARVVVMRDEGGVGDALVKRLHKAGATALVLDPGTPTDDVLAHLEQWCAEGPVSGVYWLAALDDEGDLTAYDLPTWHEALRRRVKVLYATMRRLWDDGAFLVSATRLGGYHGYSAAGAASALGGAVTGFTKSYKKERPGALVKAVDLPVDRKTAAVADLLIEETLRDPGCVEIGRVDGRRFGIALLEQPFPARGSDGAADTDTEAGMPLTSDSVVLVTGAAGSIVSAITADLAVASGGTFHLLDLTPAPDRADPDIAAFRTEPASLKGTIAARLKERGEKPTPVLIDRELAHVERLEAALTCIEAVEAAGGTAHYYAVDLTDAAAVGSVMDQVRERSGRVDVLLHAAGVEISRNLPEKEPREFDLVFDVKTTGWFNVWQAARTMEVGAVVAFSSVAGRFGNNGQTDYAAANDLLCKVVSSLRAIRPQTRGLALDWTAWGGIGMATRGSIPKIMEMAGVQVLPPEAGVAWIRRELTASPFSGEVVVAGALGMMATEYHETGGVDADAVREQHPFGPMVGDLTVSVHDGVVSRVTLDPAEQGFLTDHRIDGTPVLPGVMGMEAFAEVAGLVAPAGYRVGGVEDVGFLAPVKFYRDEPRTLTVAAVTAPDPEGGDDLVAHCTLTAQRLLPGSSDPVRTTHFTGRVRLTGSAVEEERSDLDRATHEPVVDAAQVYRFYFHGPAYQVVEAAWRDGDGSTARLPERLPEDRQPSDAPLALAPRLVELCFQTAGLWEAAQEDRLALPMSVGRVRVLLDPATATAPLVAHAEAHGGHVDALVVDDEGRVVVRLDGYTTVPLPGGVPDDVRGPLQAAFEPGTPA